MPELLCNRFYPALIDPCFLKLRERLLGEVLECNAVGFGLIAKGGRDHEERHAHVALCRCQCLEFIEGRNVDVKHCLLVSAGYRRAYSQGREQYLDWGTVKSPDVRHGWRRL